MSLLSKVKNKSSNFLYRNVLYYLGYGRPDKKADWEGAFKGGYWDFLESKEEGGRYNAISNLVKEFKNNAKVLDVGCGKGVLYQYLRQTVSGIDYTGIDISESAVKAASERFPDVTFKAMDFDITTIDDKFDVIILNETLEYFKRPAATLHRCVQMNLFPGGCFIISMYQGHDGIWKQVNNNFKTVAEKKVHNDKNQEWKIKLIKA